MYLVIGSGPAGIAAAKALVDAGHRVTILDVGRKLEDERRRIVERMSAQEPGEWSRDDLETIEGERQASREAVHSKLSYGSSFSFGSGFPDLDIQWRNESGFNHSLAAGGLSNVWGSSLLPYRQEDMVDWPVSLADLEPHYRKVMEFVPGTAVHDDLEEILPSYSSSLTPLEPSRQGRALLDDLARHRAPLKQSGVHFGRSRLAIRAAGGDGRRPCAYCALCLSGCPYGLIYSSAQTLEEMVASGMATYRDGHIVESFESEPDRAVVKGRLLENNEPFSITGKRVFIAAGVLPTAMIVLNSFQKYDHPVRLPDSQYFIYPLLRFGKTDGVENEKMHTSSQVFLEIDDKSVSKHLVHIQVYGYSNFLHQELKRTFLAIPLRLAAFRRHFLGRLLVAQGFIHSSESGHLELTLRKDASGKVRLECASHRSAAVLKTALRIGWKLMTTAMALRAIPLFPGLKFPAPGSGYHSGGSFPMRNNPHGMETDVMGCLPGHDRVHLVDASVLPCIAATSVTFSVMANAHRIASTAAGIDTP